MQHSGKQQQ